jgi:hypothetical protein
VSLGGGEAGVEDGDSSGAEACDETCGGLWREGDLGDEDDGGAAGEDA